MMVTGAGALFQPLVGLLLDLAWTGETAQARASTTRPPIGWPSHRWWRAASAGFLCLLAVRETYCRPAEAHHTPGTSP